MCGITGLLDRTTGSAAADLSAIADEMARTLSRRGPDDHAVWSDRDAGVALGHRRLSIIDPSPAAAQPMVSASGRCVIAYHGATIGSETCRGRVCPFG